MTATTTTAGRGWAYLGAALGGAVSIAANVAHSYVRPEDAPADWTPDPGAVVGSIFWPVALFVAVEILARTAWPTGRRWTALRFGGLLPVALVAALVSYRHLSGLLAFYGEDAVTVTVGPLAVDGLMLMATGALLATGRRTATAATATASATVSATLSGDRAATATTAPAATVAAPVTVADMATASASPRPPTAARPQLVATVDINPRAVPGRVAVAAKVDRPQRASVTARPSASAASGRPADDTAAKVAALLAEQPNATGADVAARLGVPARTARRHLAAARASLPTAASAATA